MRNGLRIRLAGALGVCVALGAAAPAAAVLPGHATVGYDTTTPPQLDYTAAPADGVGSDLRVAVGTAGGYVFRDPNETLVPGTGCAGGGHQVHCNPPTDALSSVQIFTFGADDRVVVNIPTETVIDGGAGDDDLTVGMGMGVLDGDQGSDHLTGGPKGDAILGDRTRGDRPGRPGDGQDTINGRGGNDVIDGGGAADVIQGGAGGDSITGGFGSDQLSGGPGNNIIRGSHGDDHLNGGAGRDQLFGDSGDDVLHGFGGADKLHGGTGADTLNSRDGTKDSDFCGAGTDTAFVDQVESALAGCETVHTG